MLSHPRLFLALIAVAAVWGITFPLVQDAIGEMPPLRFLAIRFAIAAAALGFALRRADRRTVYAGMALGAIVAGGYVAQTLALQTSSSTNVAFITGMYVTLTPVIAAGITRTLPGPHSIIGVLLATGGLLLLAAPSGLPLAGGDALALLCATLFAAHIIGTGLVARGVDPITLTAVQMVTGAILLFGLSLPIEDAAWTMPGRATLGTLLLTGVGASALALIVQTKAQRVLPATPVAVTLTMETVFGGIAGYVLAGDRLAIGGAIGALAITAGMIVASLRPDEPLLAEASAAPEPTS